MRVKLFSAMFMAFACVGYAHADDAALVEEGIALKARAESGDAAAMMSLAELLIKHAPEPKRPYTICDGKLVNPLIKSKTTGQNCKTVVDEENQKRVELWKPVGSKFTAVQWITKAAEAGDRRAISIMCGPKDDPQAPAQAREQAERWCSKL